MFFEGPVAAEVQLDLDTGKMQPFRYSGWRWTVGYQGHQRGDLLDFQLHSPYLGCKQQAYRRCSRASYRRTPIKIIPCSQWGYGQCDVLAVRPLVAAGVYCSLSV
jgi:hypothetical protein